MISIIIPVFNQADKIGACLDSILLQSYQNFEVIIVDDGSSDNIDSVLDSYRQKLNLKIVKQKNQGANIARNNGYKLSNGEYLLFCDADIFLRKDMLEKMHSNLVSSEASYVYSSHTFGFKKFKLWEFDEEKLRQMPYIHTTSMIKKIDFPGFDSQIKRLQDWDLWLTMLENKKIGKWIPEYLFNVEAGGTMSSWIPSIFYKVFPFLPSVKKYKKSVQIIKNKHNIHN
jgi:glycosyltransferase involved in cell wall biosynthesis